MYKKLVSSIITLVLILSSNLTVSAKVLNTSAVNTKNEVTSRMISKDNISSLSGQTKLSYYEDPSNYPLIEPSTYACVLKDSLSSYHYIVYKGIQQSTVSDTLMDIMIEASTDNLSNKDLDYTLEFYKLNSNNLLDFAGYIDQPITDQYKIWKLTNEVKKSDFTDQEYIYIRYGVSPSTSTTTYSDSRPFKVRNPYYIPTIKATGVSLDKSTLRLGTGETANLTATVNPTNTTNQNVVWSSNNTSVATVDSNGLVTVVGKGTAVVTVTTVDGGFTASCTVTVMDMQAARDFVTRFYQQCLNRLPDEAGLSYWADSLKTGTSTGADVANNFISGQEFINSNVTDDAFVDIMYNAFFNRASDSQGKDYWLSNLSKGISRTYVLAAFVNSQEFNTVSSNYGIDRGSIVLTRQADLHPDVATFTYRFYDKCLSRKPDSTGLDYWANALVSGQSTAADLSLGFVFSPEFTSKNLSDSDFAAVMYRVFFDREPDSAGQAYWVKVMSNGNSRKYVLANFVGSQEFKNICNTYGIKTGSIPQ